MRMAIERRIGAQSRELGESYSSYQNTGFVILNVVEKVLLQSFQGHFARALKQVKRSPIH